MIIRRDMKQVADIRQRFLVGEIADHQFAVQSAEVAARTGRTHEYAHAGAARDQRAHNGGSRFAIRDGCLASRNYRFGRIQILLISSINLNRLGMAVGLTRRLS